MFSRTSRRALRSPHIALAAAAACFVLWGCGPDAAPGDAAVLQTITAPLPADGSSTVVWISIDGVRADYLERAETPFFDRLVAEGAFSLELVPVFPSLTFPSHVSQATGVRADVHGVTGNVFVDRRDWSTHRYPWEARLMEAEPIWTSAARQGVRVAVHDWALSHAQSGPNASAYFGQRFDPALSDEQRLAMVLESWESDIDSGVSAPLRLLMGYVVGPDPAGHQHGPDAPEPIAAMQATDALLGAFAERAMKLWERVRAPDDILYLLITTDHGMLPAHTLVNFGNLVAASSEDDVELVTSGSVGHVFIRGEDGEAARAAAAGLAAARLDGHAFATAYLRDELPEEWGYGHPERTGDVVVVLDAGYLFSSRPPEIVMSAAEAGGPFGMHGYDPARHPEMNGFMIVWRYPEPIGGVDLGNVHSLRLHATVADLLGIEPAAQARTLPISLDP